MDPPGQGQVETSASAQVYIGASSPLLSYKPERNGPVGYGWIQDDAGYSSCQGQGIFSLALDGFYCECKYVTPPSYHLAPKRHALSSIAYRLLGRSESRPLACASGKG
jgi:hypothetical protein